MKPPHWVRWSQGCCALLAVVVAGFGALRSGAAETARPAAGLSEAEFFAPDRLLEVQITLAPADYEVLRQQKREASEQFSPVREEKATPLPRVYDWFKADLVVDGIPIRQVRMRKRGFVGSVSSDRPSFNIEFPDGREFAGQSRMILHNNNQDLSQVQQVLAYKVLAAAGVPAPRCNLAHVTVNGKDLGIYSHLEAIEKPFLKRQFGSARGNLYEASISDFRPRWVNTFEAKNNNKKSDRNDLERLVQALEAQDGVTERVAKLVDLDPFLSFWAAESLINHWDGFTGHQNNTFVYHDPATDRFRFIAWGADATFGPANIFAPYPPPASVMAVSRLPRRLYDDPAVRERYRERMRHLLATVWNEQELLGEVNRLEKVVRPRITVPVPLFELGLERVRRFLRSRRAEIEAELAQPAGPWTYPDRTARHRQNVGSLSATFATVWSTNVFSAAWTNFPSLHEARLDLDFYSRAYANPTARSRGGIAVRHPSWAAVQIVAPIEGVAGPILLTLCLERELMLKGGVVPLDGKRAIGYLLVNDPSQSWYRILSWLADGQATVTIEKAGLNPGDEIRGSVKGPLLALPWEDYDLRKLTRVLPRP